MDESSNHHFPRNVYEAKDSFKRFIKEFQDSFSFIYREKLQSNGMQGRYYLEVLLQHVESECENVAFALREKPLRYLPLCEEAIKEVYQEFSAEKDPPNFQLIIRSDENSLPMRRLESSYIEKLVCVSGIVIQVSMVEHKTFCLRLRCKSCGNHKDISLRSIGKSRAYVPRRCDTDEGCGMDPYVIIGEECIYQDVQMLKLQELPEDVPTGEMPRATQAIAIKYLCDKLTAGQRVSVIGVFTADETSAKEVDSSVKISYLHMIGLVQHSSVVGITSIKVTQLEEENFKRLARSGRIRDMIFDSIAPAIKGSRLDCIDDVKKAIACLLFGGSRKRLPDSTKLRGDINVLLLGDPGTAKSQFLKFVERAAPIAVYTSGKGSSAAGLTAAVVRDSSGKFALEGGAMVLADGGCVCIDEFDKMRPDDRVAIHEAMEQQTISIAKAGITTVLNTRCSVLAAANPIFGTWSSLSETAEQMDFATTILSRFDLIFLVKDVRDEARDLQIATHIISLHSTARSDQNEESNAPLKIADIRKYINFARTVCDPRLTDRAASLLQNHYVTIRKRMLQEKRSGKGSTIPITVRQLEALVRISESLARMELSNDATEAHVEEAIRLFTLSTLDAAYKNCAGLSLSEDDRKKIIHVEDAIRRRIHIGGKKSKANLIRDLETEFEAAHVQHAIQTMVMRVEIEETGDHCLKRIK
jgi:DNA replication licensing factor MCM5